MAVQDQDMPEDQSQDTVALADNTAPSQAQGQPPDTAPQQAQPVQSAAPSSPPSGPQSTGADDELTAFMKQHGSYVPPTELDMNEEHQRFGEDLQMGHIQAPTYHDLFAKKDTLGKIGTIFGLLLSGAGSGLAHQQNAALHMMDNELNMDLEAQKLTKSNAINMYQISIQNELNKQQMARLAIQNQLEKEKNPYEIQKLIAEKNYLDKQAAVSGSVAAKNGMLNIAIRGALPGVVKSFPDDSPQKSSAGALLDSVQKAGDAEAMQGNARAAAQIKLMKPQWHIPMAPPQAAAISPGTTVDPSALARDAIDDNEFNRRAGLDAEGVGIAGFAGSLGQANTENNMVKTNRALAGQWANSYNKLNDLYKKYGPLVEQFKPSAVATERAALEAIMARDTTGRYNTAEAKNQALGMLPDWRDWGSDRAGKFKKGVEFWKSQEAATGVLDRYKLKRPFPELKFGGEGSPKKSPKKADVKPYGGKEYVRGPNGEAVEVKKAVK